MSRLVPDNPHEIALWLLEALQSVRQSPLYAGETEGELPTSYDFDHVIGELEAHGGGVYSDAAKQTRTIRFNSTLGGVYPSLAAMLDGQRANQYAVPDRFVLLDIGYHFSGDQSGAPEEVLAYFDMVKLAKIVVELSDYPSAASRYRNFVVRPDARFRVYMGFDEIGLARVPEVDAFARDFIGSEYHETEKRDIARDNLATIAAGRDEVTMKDVADAFPSFLKGVRTSYAMLLSKFSAASVQKELDKQNLEDTLRLNKTFAEIQNQLLALPAALLVAGAAFEVGKVYKNASIVVGITIFAVLMWFLLRNQENSVEAIKAEIQVRRSNLKDQPALISEQYEVQFKKLDDRVTAQVRTINVVRGIVGFVLFIVVYAGADSASDGGLTRWMAELCVRALSLCMGS